LFSGFYEIPFPVKLFRLFVKIFNDVLFENENKDKNKNELSKTHLVPSFDTSMVRIHDSHACYRNRSFSCRNAYTHTCIVIVRENTFAELRKFVACPVVFISTRKPWPDGIRNFKNNPFVSVAFIFYRPMINWTVTATLVRYTSECECVSTCTCLSRYWTDFCGHLIKPIVVFYGVNGF